MQQTAAKKETQRVKVQPLPQFEEEKVMLFFFHDTENSINTVTDYVQQSFRILSFASFPSWGG